MYFNKLLLVSFITNLLMAKHFKHRTGKPNNLHALFGK